MPTSDIGQSQPSLPGSSTQTATGKETASAPQEPTTRRTPHTLHSRARRKVKPPEDIDSDYAEEAEDFFYGEGM